MFICLFILVSTSIWMNLSHELWGSVYNIFLLLLSSRLNEGRKTYKHTHTRSSVTLNECQFHWFGSLNVMYLLCFENLPYHRRLPMTIFKTAWQIYKWFEVIFTLKYTLWVSMREWESDTDGEVIDEGIWSAYITIGSLRLHITNRCEAATNNRIWNHSNRSTQPMRDRVWISCADNQNKPNTKYKKKGIHWMCACAGRQSGHVSRSLREIQTQIKLMV